MIGAIASIDTSRHPLLSIDAKQRTLLLSLNNFTINIFTHLKEIHPDANIIFSPLGLVQSLACFIDCQSPDTKKLTLKAIGLAPEISERFLGFLNVVKFTLMDLHSEGSNYTLKMLKHLYHNDPQSEQTKFSEIQKGECTAWSFDSALESMLDVKQRMTDNMAGSSDGLLPNILSNGKVSISSRMVLLNGNYFSSKWQHHFEIDKQLHDFSISPGKKVKLQMMSLEGMLGLNFDPFLRCHIISIPFQGGRLRMIILMRATDDKVDDLDDLIRINLSEKKFMIGPIVPTKVKTKLSIPLFNISETIDIKFIMNKMEMKHLTEAKHRSFMEFGNGRDLFVTEAYQKNVINFTQEGLDEPESGLDTRHGHPKAENIKLNRPFHFFILDDSSGVILFFGRLQNPTRLTGDQDHDEL